MASYEKWILGKMSSSQCKIVNEEKLEYSLNVLMILSQTFDRSNEII
jgi:hypothetical protein